MNPVAVTELHHGWAPPPSLRAERSNPARSAMRCCRTGLLRRFAPRNDEEKKRKRNAVRRCSVTTAALRAAALPHPRGGGSTTSGVPPQLLPKGVVVPKAQLGPGFPEYVHQTKRTCRLCRTQLQRAPRTPVIVPAGMMSEPPGNGSDEPPSAGTTLAPPTAVTRLASFT